MYGEKQVLVCGGTNNVGRHNELQGENWRIA